VALSTLLLVELNAQSQAPERPAFEVASIKPNKTSSDPRTLIQAMALQYLPGGRFSARAVPIPVLIFEAYNVSPGPSRRIDLSPEFQKSLDRGIEAEPYDIEAVAEKGAIPANASPSLQRERIRLMLQTLLADRFKVRILRENKEMPVYALVVGKNGARLQKSALDETQCTAMSTDKPQFLRLLVATDSSACHSFAGGPRPGLRGQAVDMLDLAAVIERFSDRPVVERTGLAGLYKIDIPGWDMQEKVPRPAGSEPTVEDRGLADPSRPNMSDVIQNLGLRLESTKAAVETFVVEHFERPTQN
jgi:uncharacterized protein (TIGR03435 family)